MRWAASRPGAGDIAQNADEFLVTQIRAGDSEAWRQLIARYDGRLRAFARARLRDEGDADDVVQETFLGFLQSLSHFDTSRSLETYLFAIVRYKIGDVCRRKRLPTPADLGPESEEGDDLLDRASVDETPSGVARKRESREGQYTLIAEGLRQLIREYGERDRLDDLRVVELSFYMGRRNKEIAAQLGLDEKHVAGVKFRAIGRLRELIESSATVEVATIGELTDEAGIARVWREQRVSCLKRSTLGAYQLDVLEKSWAQYVRFHLEVIGCPFCAANLADLEAQARSREQRKAWREQVFASSVGFLSRVSRG